MAEPGPSAIGTPLRAGGTILLLALFFLLLLGIVAATVMQSAALQLRMAMNEQVQQAVLQEARSIARAVASNPANFPAHAAPGEILCPTGLVDARCTARSLADPDFVPRTAPAQVGYRVVREPPERLLDLPLREWEEDVSSALGTEAALFEVRVRISPANGDGANAQVVRGVLRRLPR